MTKGQVNMFDKLASAKTQLVLDHPFFAAILLQRPLIASADVQTFGVNARGTIYYNPFFVESLTIRQIAFALSHECMHVMLMHAVRRGDRDPEAWNHAGDKVINDTLLESGVGDWIDGILSRPGARNMTTEELYDVQQSNTNAGCLGHDLIDDADLSESEIREIEISTKVMVAQAAQVARMHGRMSVNLDRIIDGIINVQTPWHEILERYMTQFTKNDYSWAKPNRRHIYSNVYLPSADRISAMGEMVLVVDTSGSVSTAEIEMFQGQMNRIMETCRPEKLYVVYCDSDVRSVDTYDLEELPATFRTPSGGGGTDLRKAFDWINDKCLSLDCTVILTDGYTPFPDAVDHPTAWLITTDAVSPVGITIRLCDGPETQIR